MKSFLSLFALLITVAGLPAQTVTINIGAAQLTDADGVPLFDDSLVLLLARTTEIGDRVFDPLQGNSSLAMGGYLNAHDVIIGIGAVSAFSYAGETTVSTGSLNLTDPAYSMLMAGQSVAVAWFPLVNISASVLPAGTPYGLFSADTPINESSAWEIPELGGSAELHFYTTNVMFDFHGESIAGEYAPEIARASFTTTAIPEPATCAAIFGVFALAASRWRRRKNS